MSYEQISKEQFEKVMSDLEGMEVWLKVFTDTITIDICYPEFEFLSFVKGEYLFGHKTYDEEHEFEYQNITINMNKIVEIHRDLIAHTLNEEQIILTLIDGLKVIVESNHKINTNTIALPKCYKCGNEIHVPEETIWNIFGNANYGSYYDDPDENRVINSLVFCDDCVAGFVGEVGEQNEEDRSNL